MVDVGSHIGKCFVQGDLGGSRHNRIPPARPLQQSGTYNSSRQVVSVRPDMSVFRTYSSSMVRRRVEIEYPDDAELGQSRQADGASSPNFYVSNYKGVRGQVKIFDIEDDEAEPAYPEPDYLESERRVAERDPFAEAISEALAQVMTHYINLGFAKAAPHVKAWVADKAMPAMKSTVHSSRRRIMKGRKAAQTNLPGRGASAVAATDPSTELDAPRSDDEHSMSGQEAQTRVAAALLARAFSDEQLRMVFSARIDDGGEFLAWMNSLEKRTPAEIEERIHLMIESIPGFLEEFFATLLGGRHAGNQPEVLSQPSSPRSMLSG